MSAVDPIDQLVETAGGYLRNTVKAPGLNCRACARPAKGFDLCYQCRQHVDVEGTARVVAPLIYGVARRQTGVLLRHYKDNFSERRRKKYAQTLARILYAGISLHQRCVEAAVGQPVDRRVTVPSSRGRPGIHPFAAIAKTIGAVGAEPALLPVAAEDDRQLRDNRFRVEPDLDLRGRHVMILDDTWTSGANAQSAALALSAAGASAVSIMVVGRWLDPDHRETAVFISSLTTDYDPYRCPITGAVCP